MQGIDNVTVVTADARLAGDLQLVPGARGIVLFAHGSGSSRSSPRNRFVAEALARGGFATLLFDLLTPDEEAIDTATARLRFDIDLLARRLVGATDWLVAQPALEHLGVGYFGASTGAAAALIAATVRPDIVQAVVSRGGRPDLAGAALERVRAPTLLIVGGADTPVIDLNFDAHEALRVQKNIAIIPGATHLFEEPGALEQVAGVARRWFAEHLEVRAPARRAG